MIQFFHHSKLFLVSHLVSSSQCRYTPAPGPNGRLNAIHTQTYTIQTKRKAMEYGSIREIMVPIPVSLLYFWAIPMTMGK